MADQNDYSERERGHSGDIVRDVRYGETRDEFRIVYQDPNPNLDFPFSVELYDRMRRTDPQIGALLRAVTLPIMAAKWQLLGDGVEERVLNDARAEFGLPADGDGRKRRGRGIVFREHLRDALKCVPFGFMPFERVWEAGAPYPGQSDADGDLMHVRKLAPRMPRTVDRITVEKDGGLGALYQRALEPTTGNSLGEVKIERRDLVVYVLDREGANWYGTSLLRPIYRDFIIKEQLLRFNSIAIEKASVPTLAVPYDASDQPEKNRQEALKTSSSYRSGSRTGVAFPMQGGKPEMIGTSTHIDPMPSIKYHDEQMSKSILAMFLDLGHDAGARSLGDTFTDVFTGTLQSIADLVADVFTEYVIRPWVDANFPEGTPYPVLSAGDMAVSRGVSVADLVALKGAGLIDDDPGVLEWVRQRIGTPEPEPSDDDGGTDVLGDLEQQLKQAQIENTKMLTAQAGYRGGFEAESLVSAYGLPAELVHNGLVPVTLQDPAKTEAEAAAAVDAAGTGEPTLGVPGADEPAVELSAQQRHDHLLAIGRRLLESGDHS